MHSGEAYDFSMFEERANRQLREEPAAAAKNNMLTMPEDSSQKQAKVRLHKHPVRAAACYAGLAMMLVVLSTFVYGQVQLSELAVEISNANSTLSEQQSLYTQLRMQNDARQSLTTIETEAKQKLGMQKIDSSQMETVEMNSSDKAQVLQKTSGGFLTQLWNRICDLLS